MEEKINELKELLKEHVVVFEYTKKDGSIRTAKGTLVETYLPEKEPEEFELDKKSVDYLVETKYESFDKYLESNKIELIEESENVYKFKHKKKERKRNENLVSYYDLDKDEFRSFNKDNFIGIISVD